MTPKEKSLCVESVDRFLAGSISWKQLFLAYLETTGIGRLKRETIDDTKRILTAADSKEGKADFIGLLKVVLSDDDEVADAFERLVLYIVLEDEIND